VEDPDTLAETRTRYGIPERFVMTLTKIAGDGRKNFGNLVDGYRRYHGSVPDPLPLVVGGKDVVRFRGVYGIPDDGWGADVHFPGWIDQSDLPALFSSAATYLYTSNLEAFPIPLTEAMACGTPIVTSNVNGLVEIADDAAVFVDPRDPDAIGAALRRVLTDPVLAADLSRRGLARSRAFSWDRCAAQTLEILREAAGRVPAAVPA
jgi:glycosyltransferase involved in cell wall biosynthesis